MNYRVLLLTILLPIFSVRAASNLKTEDLKNTKAGNTVSTEAFGSGDGLTPEMKEDLMLKLKKIKEQREAEAKFLEQLDKEDDANFNKPK